MSNLHHKSTIPNGDAASLIMEMLVVIGVQSYRTGLDDVGDLVMRAVKKLEPDVPGHFIPTIGGAAGALHR